MIRAGTNSAGRNPLPNTYLNKFNVTTTDATSTLLGSLTLSDLQQMSFTADVIAISNTMGTVAKYKIEANLHCSGTTVTLDDQYSLFTTETDENLNVSIDVATAGTVKLMVNGIAANTIQWQAIVNYHIQDVDISTLAGFTTEWVVGAGDSITLPLVQSRAEGSLAYDCYVDWGDGTALSHVTAYNSASRIHTYTNSGTYQVEIKGTCEGWSFNNSGSKLKITKIIDWGNSHVFYGFKYLKSAFFGCTNLTSLASGGILASGTGVLSDRFYAMFANCSSLVAIPSDLFKNHVNVTTSAFYETFYSCTSLTTIPTDLFKYNVNVSSNAFDETFIGCTSLTTIPTDLFKYNVNVSSYGFKSTFASCTSLITIPSDLFKYNVNVSSNGFNGTFTSCTSLTTIPTDLFKYNTLVSDYGFYCTFRDCSSLTTIPTDLFRYNTLVSNYGFYQTFLFCSSLTTIPTDLFRYNVNVSDQGFVNTFANCTLLETVPNYLFKYNTSCTHFSYVFSGCNKLQLNAEIFYANGEQSTRFLNKNVNFGGAFSRSSFTGVQGIAPDLWNCNFGTGTIIKSSYDGAGNSLTSLSNYASIPTEWKTF